MKKGIYILLVILSFSISSCSKNDDDNTTKSFEFAGTWSGSYTGDEAGTWTATISESGTLTGKVKETTSSIESTLNGTVTTDGALAATAGTTSQGYDFVGKLNGNSGSGTWTNTSSNHSGNWSGNKE